MKIKTILCVIMMLMGLSVSVIVAEDLHPGVAPVTYSREVGNFIGWVDISGGRFSMGSNNVSISSDEKPAHSVTLSGFKIMDHEVTAAKYKECVDAGSCTYTGGTGSYYTYNRSGYGNHPVNYVSWHDAKAYADWEGARLCTEAEWEYAARAGTTTEWACGSNASCLNDYAWYDSNSGTTTHAVKTKQANAWGVYDMAGNVWEWTADWYDSYSSGSVTNPTGPSSGSNRVNRGGGFSYSGGDSLRSAFRISYSPGDRNIFLGFRLCSSL
ncbi:formylglycine-generating enzyme family protein [Deltaproteobacteria bacterium TL4]